MIIETVPYEHKAEYSLEEIVYFTRVIKMGLATLNKHAEELSRQIDSLEKRMMEDRDVAV